MKKLIITEGKDDQKFFIGLLSYLKITDVEVVSVNEKARGGKANIFTIDDVQKDVTGKTEELASKILITCDADFVEQGGVYGGFEKTKTASEEILKNLRISEDNANKVFEFFIIPNNKSDGNLESLYLDCLFLDPSALRCVEDYLDCLSSGKIPLKKNSKIKALSLLAPIGSNEGIYKVGFAALLDEKNKKHREGYWNFESSALKPLTEFLKNFFN